MADDKDDTDKDAEVAAVPANGKKKKILLIVGGIVGLLLVIGVPVILLSSKGSNEHEETAELDADAAQHGKNLVAEGFGEEDELLEGEEPLGAFFPLDTFVVNLAKERYLRVQVQLEFSERDVPRRFYTRLVLIRDAIITLLTSKTFDSLQESKDKDELKKEIKDVVNEILRKEEVKKVYFTQFIVQ